MPRDLLPDERYFLDVLLSQPFNGRDELREQAHHVSVTGLSCSCGCPSVGLAVDRTAPPAPVSGMVAEGVGVDADGNLVGVMLLVDDGGYMYDLDVWAFGGDVHGQRTESYGRPTIESFELSDYEDAGEGFRVLKNMPRGPTA